MVDLTHDGISAIAAKWLTRSHSGNGAGCHVSFTEVGGLFGGERADAWGYRWGWDGGSVLVETKVSRSDFLADSKKPHRNGEIKGMGFYRYYICPEGLITVDDLPEKWGLLWVNKRGHVKLKAGHLEFACSYSLRDNVSAWQHDNHVDHEMNLMAHLLKRLGNPEKMNQEYRENMRRANRLATELERTRKENNKSRRELDKLRRYLKANGIDLESIEE